MPRTSEPYYRQLEQIAGMTSAPQFPAIRFPTPTANLGTGMPPTGAGGDSGFQRFISAISGQESGGSYASRNSSSGAMGRYQIMPANLPGWSREALGRNVSIQQFMSNPRIQDAIAQYKLRQYVNRYGYQGAAAAWYGGPGVAKGWNSRTNPQGAYPSIASYVAQVMRRMGK